MHLVCSWAGLFPQLMLKTATRSRSHGKSGVARALDLIGRTLHGLAPLLVLVCLSEKCKSSVSSASFISWTPFPCICRFSPQPRRPKWSELKSQRVFINASPFWNSKEAFFRRDYWSNLRLGLLRIRSTTFALFQNFLFLASRHFLALSKATSSMTLTGYFHFFFANVD